MDRICKSEVIRELMDKHSIQDMIEAVDRLDEIKTGVLEKVKNGDLQFESDCDPNWEKTGVFSDGETDVQSDTMEVRLVF